MTWRRPQGSPSRHPDAAWTAEESPDTLGFLHRLKADRCNRVHPGGETRPEFPLVAVVKRLRVGRGGERPSPQRLTLACTPIASPAVGLAYKPRDLDNSNVKREGSHAPHSAMEILRVPASLDA